MTEALQREWTFGKGPNDRIDILYITAEETSKVDVAKVFSVSRLCKLAESAGLSCGGSFDIITGWDFRSEKKRKELREKLNVMKPRLLLICPPCGTASTLQGLNKHVDVKEWLSRVQEGKSFVKFSMQLANDQMKRGDCFLFEQPHGAKTWENPDVIAVAKQPGVQQVVMDQCMFGLKDVANGKPHRKRTRLLVNNDEIARRLSKLCDKSHTHTRTCHWYGKD